MTFETVYIGLGSNLGNRHQYLQRAVDHLCVTPELGVDQISSVVESPALVLPGSPPQPHYLNAVVACSTTLAPVELLKACLEIEEKLGRTRSELVKWEPRTVDLDLLMWGNRVMKSPHLTLPHPGLGRRAFVLIPLSEIAMDLRIPAPFNCDIRYLLDHCPGIDSTSLTPFQLMISRSE
ncbi:MAG: 2-amino-4-hydroxy-6-hydroxymethyldihydropteridine diphosphokinase [Bacteroidetes bacterium]|nr:2-amino-4-hydroxy-6-hydroxymethyldihydropteridine diphosphokinase [Bacteroidota bacterium]